MKKKTIMAVLIGMTVIMTQQRIIVLAATTSGDRQSSTVSATVPDKHTITIDKDAHVTITYEDSKDEGEGDAFPIERFSTPTFTIETEDGWEIDKILLDGVDITSQLSNKKLTLPSVYQNQTLKISTKIKPVYTVVIPQDTNVQFNKLTENFGKISMEKVWLEDGKCIEVLMSSAGNLTNQKDSSKLIPYQILEEGKILRLHQQNIRRREKKLLCLSTLNKMTGIKRHPVLTLILLRLQSLMQTVNDGRV